MSISRRLLNLARAEIRGALKGLEHPIETFREKRKVRAEVDELLEEMRRGKGEREEAQEEAPREERRSSSGRTTEVTINRWYANLELPIGAPEAEVRASYRRLMRRYHPDRHFADPEAARVATELSTQLREAYEGLLEHLSKRAG